MKLKTVIEQDFADRRWFWKLENGKVSIYGELTYPSEKDAKQAAAEFMNKCLTDRSTWPKWFK